MDFSIQNVLLYIYFYGGANCDDHHFISLSREPDNECQGELRAAQSSDEKMVEVVESVVFTW